jgi:hypothetical protein
MRRAISRFGFRGSYNESGCGDPHWPIPTSARRLDLICSEGAFVRESSAPDRIPRALQDGKSCRTRPASRGAWFRAARTLPARRELLARNLRALKGWRRRRVRTGCMKQRALAARQGCGSDPHPCKSAIAARREGRYAPAPAVGQRPSLYPAPLTVAVPSDGVRLSIYAHTSRRVSTLAPR